MTNWTRQKGISPMVDGLLDKPVPIIFAVCQAVQAVQGGTFNVLGVFDRLTIRNVPNSTVETVTLPVVAVWTGAQGDFTQVLTLLDEDGNQLLKAERQFSLPRTTHRHYIAHSIVMPAKPGTYTLVIGRADMEDLLRQDFTIASE